VARDRGRSGSRSASRPSLGARITETLLAAAIDTLLDPPNTSGRTKPLNPGLASADDITGTLASLCNCRTRQFAEGQHGTD
jgi:hypothetical protein